MPKLHTTPGAPVQGQESKPRSAAKRPAEQKARAPPAQKKTKFAELLGHTGPQVCSTCLIPLFLDACGGMRAARMLPGAVTLLRLKGVHVTTEIM